MKRFLGIFLTSAAAICIASAAHASIVLSTEIGPPGGSNPITFAELKDTALTELNMSVMDITSNMAIKRGNALFYTSSSGIVKQTIGTATVSIIKKASSVSFVNYRGPQFIISNNAATGNTGSFLYNVSTKKTVKIAPTVTSIIQGRIAPNGQWMALLGKNSKGQSRLFVSTSSIEKVKEYQLPTKATKCLSMAISPNSATLALVCEVTQSNGSTMNTLILRKFSANLLDKAQQYVDQNFSLYDVAWKDKSTVIGIGFGPASQGSSVRRIGAQSITMRSQANSPFALGLHGYTIKNGKVSKLTIYPFSTSEIVDPSMLIVPMQLYVSSKNVVDYMAVYFTTTVDGGASSLKTYLGRYNLSTKLHSVLLKNDKVNLFSEYSATSS